ncbi:MFS-type transporter SLC18B1-like isoform X2 [Symsagittifera roscoffensis]|uniref:MFS-type transporter SLC18B1-like isoform X2 n=1 Tax=Symsagittifera roscoffensis TaxID=84072 RepID=UPI00307C3023
MLSDSSSSISSIEFVHEIEEPPMEQQAQMRPLIQENHRYSSSSSSLPLWQKRLVVAICSMVLALEGVNLSLAGPFFPEKAKDKKMSQTQIGFVIGSFDLANLLFSFVVATLVSPLNLKFFNCVGILFSSVGIGCFALSSEGPNGDAYFWSALASRGVNGVAASLLYGTTMPIATHVFPEKSSLVTTIIQVSMGLGTIIGPPLGSLLIPVWGFKTPFLFTSMCEITLFILAVKFLPSRNVSNRAKVDNTDYFQFFFNFSTLSVLIPTSCLFFTSGLRDTAYALYFQKTLELKTTTIGYFFIAPSVSYILSGPIIGALVGKGYSGFISAGVNFLGLLTTCMLFVPRFIPAFENIPWAAMVLLLNGLMFSAIFNPTYLILEKVACNQGFSDSQQRKTLAASSFNLIAASGRTIGAYGLGGFINDYLGFYNTYFIYGAILAITSLWSFTFLLRGKFLQPIYYTVS